MHVRDAETEISKGLNPKTKTARNTLKTLSLENGKPSHGARVGPGSQIEVGVVNNSDITIVRHISFEPDPRVDFKSVNPELEAAYFVGREGVRDLPVDLESKTIAGRDAVDTIFAKFCVAGKDPWAHHLCDDGEGG